MDQDEGWDDTHTEKLKKKSERRKKRRDLSPSRETFRDRTPLRTSVTTDVPPSPSTVPRDLTDQGGCTNLSELEDYMCMGIDLSTALLDDTVLFISRANLFGQIASSMGHKTTMMQIGTKVYGLLVIGEAQPVSGSFSWNPLPSTSASSDIPAPQEKPKHTGKVKQTMTKMKLHLSMEGQSAEIN